MKNKVASNKDSIFYISLVLLAIISVLLFLFFFITGRKSGTEEADYGEDRMYHVLVLGRYENELFLQQVFDGAERLSRQYNALVELYVPHSQAENESLQKLFDYATYVNADGVIAYIDSPDDKIVLPHRPDGSAIPLITTGLYIPTLQQVSFIGNSYWELGRKIGDETVSLLKNEGKAILINMEKNDNPYYSNLTNAIQERLTQHQSISYKVIDNYTPVDLWNLTNSTESEKVLFICLTEQDTIQLAQNMQELGLDKNPNIQLIGFGSNEVCLHYLENGMIAELISVDPERIGENSIIELFEYRNKGYANSYVAAEVQITRSHK